MPVVLNSAQVSVGAQVRIAPSVVTELFWLVHGYIDGHHHRELESIVSAPAELVQRIRGFWGAEHDCFGELFVLAEGAGVLFEEDAKTALDAIERGPAVRLDLPLRSETDHDRDGTLDRVRRLVEEPPLRSRYVELLREAWAIVAGDWEREGRSVVRAAVARLEARRDVSATAFELLNGAGAAPKDPWRSQALAAAVEGRLAISPGYLAGTFLAWDLERTYLVGCQAEPEDEAARARRDGRRLANRLKVVADPTRLAILLYLTRHSATVTDIARTFAISQPTASTHLRLLRESGLVTGPEEGRGPLAADRAVAQELVQQAAHLLVGEDCEILTAAPAGR